MKINAGSLVNLSNKILTLGGKPFSLENRPYIMPIYNGNYPDMIIKSGRQVEKSTTAAVHLLLKSIARKYHNSLYVAPRRNQTQYFSTQRLTPMLDDSKFIKKYYLANSSYNNVFFKSFKNGSTINLSYAWDSADRTRGFSSDFNIFDEVQDLVRDNIIIINESQSHSNYQEKLYLGTPLTLDNPLETIWQTSTMNEWAVKCDACGKWNILDEDNIGKNGPICSRCGRPIDPIKNGRWVRTSSKSDLEGFRISQMMVPHVLSRWDKLLDKYEGPNAYPKNRFLNEVLALSYDTGSAVLTEADIRKYCSGPDHYKAPSELDWYHLPNRFMGIDWGTGENCWTAVTIITYDGKKAEIIYGHIFDHGEEVEPDYQLAEIRRLIKAYRVTFIGADYGGGFVQGRNLAREFDNFVQYEYAGSMNKRLDFNIERGRYSVNRTEIMAETIWRIKNGFFLFPKWSVFKPYADHYTSLYAEPNSRGKLRYEHKDGQPDDAFHSTIYAYLSALIYTNSF